MPLTRSTPIDEYAHWLLLSRWDGQRYRLSSWHDGELRDLQERPQATVFDARLHGDRDRRPDLSRALARQRPRRVLRACHGDLGGCSSTNSGAIRSRISSGRYEIDGAVEAWSGWAWSGAAGYHVASDYACSGADPGIATQPCGLYRRRGLAWQPIDAERVR